MRLIEHAASPSLHAPTPADIASARPAAAGAGVTARPRWLRRPDPTGPLPDDYKWVALFISTLGMLMATIDGSIVLISLPDIFRGIGINPLLPGNSFYLLWMILGFLVTTSVLVVTLGRLGDMYGRVRMYNLGLRRLHLLLARPQRTWLTGAAAGMYLIVMRIFQGVGAAMLMANSAAILTDAFPENQRGMALGVNQAAAFSGSFIGLILGGHPGPDQLAPHLLGVGAHRALRHHLGLPAAARAGPAPLGPHRLVGQRHLRPRAGLHHGRHHLRDRALRRPRHGLDQPARRRHPGAGRRSCSSPSASSRCTCASRCSRLSLFKIRAFTAGIVASFLAAISRGGLMFMLIIWLQGIWLPLHGYSFSSTPLWAGIAMIPLTVGMLIAGPISGVLSDRYGPRPFATGGMIGTAICFALLEALPIDFSYLGLRRSSCSSPASTMASFGAPNRTGVMNSLPPEHRGAGSGMNTTFQNSAQVISIGIFFTLMIVGLSDALPHNVSAGLLAHGVPRGRGGPGLAPAADLDPVRRLPGLQPGAAPRRGRDHSPT